MLIQNLLNSKNQKVRGGGKRNFELDFLAVIDEVN